MPNQLVVVNPSRRGGGGYGGSGSRRCRESGRIFTSSGRRSSGLRMDTRFDSNHSHITRGSMCVCGIGWWVNKIKSTTKQLTAGGLNAFLIFPFLSVPNRNAEEPDVCFF